MRRSTMLLWTMLGAGIFQSVFAQATTTAVPFLMIAPDSRASGMGESGVALADDAWATYWNPAGYVFQSGPRQPPRTRIGSRHSILGTFGLRIWYTSRTSRSRRNNVRSIHLSQPGGYWADINNATVIQTFKSYDLAFALGYATKISNVLGIGFNLRIIHSAISPFGAPGETGNGISTGYSFDVGMLYHPQSLTLPLVHQNLEDRLSLGFNLSNIGPKLTYADPALADPIPMNLRLGLALKFYRSQYNNATFIADFNKLLVNDTNNGSDRFYKALFTSWGGRTIGEEFRQFDTGIGFEYWYWISETFCFPDGLFL